MTLTGHRMFQYVGILLALSLIAGGYWYFAVRAGVKTNTSGSQPQGSGDLSSGLVGYWKFDENTGTSAADSSTNASTGTLTNGPTWTTGQIGSAVNFDGTNDYVTDPGATAADIQGLISLATWVNLDTLPVYGGNSPTILFNDTASGYYYRLQFVDLIDGAQYIQFTPGGGGTNNVSSPLTLTTGTWYHVAVTYDTNSDLVTFYLNGSVVGTSLDTVAGGYATDAGTLYFGSTDVGARLDGQLDEVRIYDRVLSSDEVTSLYRLTTPTGVDTGLKGYWSFDGGALSGTTAYDRSGVGNTGTLTNGPTVIGGRVGQALQFDGTDDYVNIPDPNAIENIDPLSTCVWINPDVVTAGIIVAKGYAFTNWSMGLNNADGGDEGLYFIRNRNSNWGRWHTPHGSITAGVWQHVCVVTDDRASTSNDPVFYINGALTTTEEYGTPSGAVTTDVDWPVSIGNLDGASNFYSGAIDEVRIYNRLLTATEVKSFYDRGAPDKSNTSAGQAAGTGRLDSDLFAYFPLDENTGTATADKSVNVNNGTLTNGPTWATGRIGSAVNFDGTNDYILNTSSAFVTALNQPHSFFAWVYPESYAASTFRSVISFGEYNDSNWNTGLALYDSTGKVVWTVDGNDGPWIESGLTVPLNQWSFVGVMRNNASEATFFVNGDTVTISDASVLALDNDPILIGAASHNSVLGGYFDGLIDEVRVYNRALSADEARRIHQLTTPTGVDTGLKGYWSFNGSDLSGTTASDRSGAGNDGTLTNGPTVKWGRLGQALQFDGTNDYVEVGNAASMQASVFTYSAWVNPSGASIRTIKGNDGSGGPQFRLTASGYLEFLKQSVTSIDTSTASVANGVWSHVAMTYDGSGNYIFYINGVPSGSGNSVQTFTFTSSELGIRDGTGGGAEPFSGSMDEVRIYDRVLTAAELKAQYEAAAPDKTNTSVSTPQGTGRLDSGLAGYWPLDNGSGTTATDLSTNATNGTLANGPTWTTGRIGSAVQFDGTNDEVSISTLPGLTGAADTPFSFAFWVNTSTVDTDEIIGWGPYRRCRPVNIAVTYGIGCTVNGDEYDNGAYSITQVNDGQWHHIVYTHDSGNQTLYVDGRLESTASQGFITGSDPISLATRPFGGYFNGKLDEVRIYSRALSADEAAQLYQLGVPTGTDTSLKGYWSFNGQDISGTTAYDRSGAGNNGTITNGPTVKWGKLGQALDFDGTNDHVNAGSASGIDNLTNKSACAWIYPETIPGGTVTTIVSKSSTNGWELSVRDNSGAPQLELYVSFSGGDGVWRSAGDSVPLNAWSHGCFTYNNSSTSNDPVFYVNGVASSVEEAQTPTGTADSDASDDFQIGALGASVEPFDGKIDEVRYYDRILSAGEIKALYSSGK